jgi:hypothetical protein
MLNELRALLADTDREQPTMVIAEETVDLYHGDACASWRGEPCDCDPVVQLRVIPDGSQR